MADYKHFRAQRFCALDIAAGALAAAALLGLAYVALWGTV